MKIMSMSNPAAKGGSSLGHFEEPLTRITICQVILSLMRRAKSYQPSRMLVGDVMDLGHNHILDSDLEGVYSTAKRPLKMEASHLSVFTRMKREARPPW